jgi:hypothetical protein
MQFVSGLIDISLPFGKYCIVSLKNSNPSNTILSDFLKNYSMDDFNAKLAKSIQPMNQQTNYWHILIGNDLKAVYANNGAFMKITNDSIGIADCEDFLINAINKGVKQDNFHSSNKLRQNMLNELGRLKEIMKERVNKNETDLKQKYFQIASLNEHNLIESVFDELKNHEVTLKGQKYYMANYEAKSDLKTDAAEFYGKETGLEKIIDSLNCHKEFHYTCMINAESRRYEIVFNDLFASYDSDKKDIAIKPLAEALANEIEKLKRNQNESSKMPPPPPPFMPPYHGNIKIPNVPPSLIKPNLPFHNPKEELPIKKFPSPKPSTFPKNLR